MSDDYYYSDRENGPRPRIETEISRDVWGGIRNHIQILENQKAFAIDFYHTCGEFSDDIAYFDHQSFWQQCRVEIPEIGKARDSDFHHPPTGAVLDLIEYCYAHVAKPIQLEPCNRENHYHYGFDREEGREKFREKINRIFARNWLVYKLEQDGKIVRVVPPMLEDILVGAIFDTGDSELDRDLEYARLKFISHDSNDREESLKLLWDAWERLKSIKFPGKNMKPKSVKVLLQEAAPEELFFTLLNTEAHNLTDIGNDFKIRHSEIGKMPIKDSDHIDYLFHRLFALIYLLLRKQGKLRMNAETQQESNFLDELPF